MIKIKNRTLIFLLLFCLSTGGSIYCQTIVESVKTAFDQYVQPILARGELIQREIIEGDIPKQLDSVIGLLAREKGLDTIFMRGFLGVDYYAYVWASKRLEVGYFIGPSEIKQVREITLSPIELSILEEWDEKAIRRIENERPMRYFGIVVPELVITTRIIVKNKKKKQIDTIVYRDCDFDNQCQGRVWRIE